MIDQFINFVIRPPRADYNPDQYLWEKDFTLAGRKYKRQDLELRNGRGHILRCSHYMPSPFPDNTSLPCVIYCHGNSGCRADANEAAVILLPSNITVFTLDFSGSGLSDGNYVSLGWHESDDLKVVVSYLRSNEQISRIGLWGRSMGAVTSLLYGAEDPSIAGMVLDSAFSNLFNLMMELVDVYKIRLPKFTVKVALQYMRRVIQKKAKFDIMDINALKVAPKTFIPALFGHAKGDKFIQPHHSDLISNSYAGDKNVIKFDGDHNSSRPQFYYDSVSIFFHNVLHPPQLSPSCSTKYEKYYDLGDLQVDAAGIEESLLYEIIGGKGQGLGMESGSASTSSAPPTILTTDSVEDYLHGTGIMPPLFKKANDVNTEAAQPQLQESCSYTSSNRESWGRCSSLGSDVEPFPDCSTSSNDNHLVRLKVLATPLRTTSKHKNAAAAEAEEKKKVVKKSSGREKLEKLEALSQRLRLCILKRVRHRRNHSS
ncbi:uncharacterized protein LOC111904061 isoform X1 [Lactuca sativa]|uniref:uncharacterized protein LOC111904061 isoform X1 n=1 Tax=Lactuca sativa TaxID=4236 RepID=UPI000CD9CB0B|nr:uncharacterized protein LOC111904061 isoform X1 [Lactuca sativa]